MTTSQTRSAASLIVSQSGDLVELAVMARQATERFDRLDYLQQASAKAVEFTRVINLAIRAEQDARQRPALVEVVGGGGLHPWGQQ